MCCNFTTITYNLLFSPYTEPDVIRNLTANNTTTSSVFLTWNEPGGNRSFFKIQWTDEKTNINSTMNTSYNITGLIAGVNYTFCITAVAADKSTEGETVCISNYTSMYNYKISVLCYIVHYQNYTFLQFIGYQYVEFLNIICLCVCTNSHRKHLLHSNLHGEIVYNIS